MPDDDRRFDPAPKIPPSIADRVPVVVLVCAILAVALAFAWLGPAVAFERIAGAF